MKKKMLSSFLFEITFLQKMILVSSFIFASVISFAQKSYTVDFDDTYGPHGLKETTTTEDITNEGERFIYTTIVWTDSADKKRKMIETAYYLDTKRKDSTIILYGSGGHITFSNHMFYDSTGKKTEFSESNYENGKLVSSYSWQIKDGNLFQLRYDPSTGKYDSLPTTPYNPEDFQTLPELNSSGLLPLSNSENKTMSGVTPGIQLCGFGGVSFINGNTPATAGFDGAVLFPLGNRVLVGPTAGFEWVNSSIVKTIGSGQPSSTFIHTSAGFKNGNFGGQIAFPLNRFELGIRGGATVAFPTTIQEAGYIDASGLSHTTTSTTSHNTVVG
ncbi:MAG: hypothetical protein ACRDE5_12895, partial [Ginsengibacter sp.]